MRHAETTYGNILETERISFNLAWNPGMSGYSKAHGPSAEDLQPPNHWSEVLKPSRPKSVGFAQFDMGGYSVALNGLKGVQRNVDLSKGC